MPYKIVLEYYDKDGVTLYAKYKRLCNNLVFAELTARDYVEKFEKRTHRIPYRVLIEDNSLNPLWVYSPTVGETVTNEYLAYYTIDIHNLVTANSKRIQQKIRETLEK